MSAPGAVAICGGIKCQQSYVRQVIQQFSSLWESVSEAERANRESKPIMPTWDAGLPFTETTHSPHTQRWMCLRHQTHDNWLFSSGAAGSHLSSRECVLSTTRFIVQVQHQAPWLINKRMQWLPWFPMNSKVLAKDWNQNNKSRSWLGGIILPMVDVFCFSTCRSSSWWQEKGAVVQAKAENQESPVFQPSNGYISFVFQGNRWRAGLFYTHTSYFTPAALSETFAGKQTRFQHMQRCI